MKEIYLIRHARQNITAFNEDVPLSDTGLRQAELLKERLKDEKFDKLYSSVLIRAVQTSDILNENWNMPIERRAELNEIDYGLLTSEPLSVKDGKYKAFFEELNRRVADSPFPGGENSEMVYRRMRKVFDEIAESRWERILIVTHGGAMRAAICGLLGLPFSKRLAFSKHLENTSITKILYDEEKRLYYLEVLNDHLHLLGHPELFREI